MVSNSNLVALDLETTGLDPRRAEIRLVQVSNGQETYVLDCRRSDVRPLVEVLAKKTVIAHGGDFEWRFLYHHYGVELKDVRDTMLMSQVLAAGNMSVKCGLGAVAKRELDIDLDKETQTSDWSSKTLTRRQLDYAAMDVQVLIPIFARLIGDLAWANLERVARIENEALPATARMKLEGMPVDKPAWDEHAEEVEVELRNLEREMLCAKWLPERDPVPQMWQLTGDDCLEMLKAAGLKDITGTTAKDLKPYIESGNGTLLLANDEISDTARMLVTTLLKMRKAKDEEERERLKQKVLRVAPAKPPKPPALWNFSSPQQVEEICYKILGFYPRRTNEATLLRYVDRHPFFRKLLEYRKLKKLVSTYGKDWFKEAYDKERSRIYPAWRQIGTSTGRFASGEKGKAPNAQNLPGDYRRFFVAPLGRTFVNADYSQIEVRIAAKMFDVKVLLKLYEEDENADVYRATAANMLGIKREDVTKEQRQLAKAIMLGMLYGLSATGLPEYVFKNYGLELNPEDATDYVERFFSVYPEIQKYHEDTKTDLQENGSVDRRTMTGRLRAGITIRNEAINAPVQGTAADGLKAAMAKVHTHLRTYTNGDPFIVATIHDELLVECDEADGNEVLEIVLKAMVEAMDAIVNETEPKVPVTVEGKVTKTWTKE